jgi:DNA topoisomerase-1
VEAKVKEQTAKTDASRAKTQARNEKRIARGRSQIETAKQRVKRANLAIGKITAQAEMASHKRTWNLGTSLKSYIDPRVYHKWGQSVGYDVIERYYPKTLRRKFAWAKTTDGADRAAEA